ncbi:hypothetical protein [Enterobacter sp. KBR-315C3_2022]|uniref:hypothetical protein n=1 Tax=Enterobacter sp. KBR-315C3_2022 TaxID=3242494 RepID=UPI003528FA6B
MQKERVFKKRYILVPLFIVLAMIGWIVSFMSFPIEHEMYKRVKVNNGTVLYVTQASAGAMTSFSYHYYFYDATKSDADFLTHVNDLNAFMVTNDDKAMINVKDDEVYLRVRGDVFSFRNTAAPVQVHLDAARY